MSIESKHAAAKQIDKLIFEWLELRYKTALVGADNNERIKAIKEMRYLHLDDYWYNLSPKIAELFIEEQS